MGAREREAPVDPTLLHEPARLHDARAFVVVHGLVVARHLHGDATTREHRSRVPCVGHDELVATNDGHHARAPSLGTLPRSLVLVLELDYLAVGARSGEDCLAHLRTDILRPAAVAVALAGQLYELVATADVHHVDIHGEERVNQTLRDVPALVRLRLLEDGVKVSRDVDCHLRRIGIFRVRIVSGQRLGEADARPTGEREKKRGEREAARRVQIG